MSKNERLEPRLGSEPANLKPKKKKTNIFKRAATGIPKWFREMRSELKKVVWLTPRQTAKNSWVAIVVMLVAAVVLWGFDGIASVVVQALIKLAN